MATVFWIKETPWDDNIETENWVDINFGDIKTSSIQSSIDDCKMIFAFISLLNISFQRCWN